MTNKFDKILETVICGVITLFFACILMVVADICVLLVAITATFLFGSQKYIIPLETLMFMVSVVVEITYILCSKYPIIPVFGDGLNR